MKYRKLLRQIGLACLLGGGTSSGLPAEVLAWKYVFDDASVQLPRPLYKTMPTSLQRPNGLKENVSFFGNQRSYIDLRYGDAGSLRVALVIDDLGSGDFHLFVDRNRDRQIEMDELVPGAGRFRTFSLKRNLPTGQRDVVDDFREIQIRRSRHGKTVSVATLGCIEGKVDVDGIRCAARRFDANGNGLYSDRIDQIWLDLNHDNKWDQFSERFAVTPSLQIDGRRYSVLADKTGTKLEIKYNDQFGKLRLRAPQVAEGAILSEVEATLTGRDGSVFTLVGLDEALELPIGKYNLDTLRLSLDYQLQPWTFVFSKMGADRASKYFEITTDHEVTIDPVGELEFSCKSNEELVKLGGTLRVSPRLHTSTGLLINTCTSQIDHFSGTSQDRTASITLREKNQILSSAFSGFA